MDFLNANTSHKVITRILLNLTKPSRNNDVISVGYFYLILPSCKLVKFSLNLDQYMRIQTSSKVIVCKGFGNPASRTVDRNHRMSSLLA